MNYRRAEINKIYICNGIPKNIKYVQQWKSSIWDYSGSYILAKGARTVVGEGANTAAISADRNYKNSNTI